MFFEVSIYFFHFFLFFNYKLLLKKAIFEIYFVKFTFHFVIDW